MTTVHGIGTNRTNVKMPAELDQFLDVLLSNPQISKTGIRHRNELARACLEVYVNRLDRLSKVDKNLVTPTKEERYLNITLPLPLSNKVDASLTYPMIRSMWYPAKTQILNAMFRSLLTKYSESYQQLNQQLFDINTQDLSMTVTNQQKILLKMESWSGEFHILSLSSINKSSTVMAFH